MTYEEMMADAEQAVIRMERARVALETFLGLVVLNAEIGSGESVDSDADIRED